MTRQYELEDAFLTTALEMCDECCDIEPVETYLKIMEVKGFILDRVSIWDVIQSLPMIELEIDIQKDHVIVMMSDELVENTEYC